MKLTHASLYALQAVAYMAKQKTDKAVPSHEIAKERKIPTRFLLKVLKPLVSARVLTSVKGPNGGYKLARSASDISILDILEAQDEPILAQAPLDSNGDGALNTKLEKVCEETAEVIKKHLEKIRLSDLISKR